MGMITIKEIAKMAGVSHATVSMVINNKKGPGEKIREKINGIIEETGYVPNLGARNLVMKKNNSIGIFLLNFPEKREDRLFYYYTELFEEIMFQAKENGYTLLFYTDRDRSEAKISYADYCRENNLKSAIFLGMSYSDPNLEELKNLKDTQVIMFDRDIDGEYNRIISDSSSGIDQMLDYFKKNNLKRVAVVKGTMDSKISTLSKIETLENLKDRYGIETNFYQGNFYRESGYNIGKKIDAERYDVIFAMNDAMAIGVMEGLKERNIKIPEEIKIVGYDNLLVTDYNTPKLATIAHNNKGITEALFELIKSSAKNEKRVIETEFIPKESAF